MFIPDLSDKRTLEKYSSAFTLSDMEVFIFPDLFYPLVLSNIISPEIWKWRDDPWFKNIETKGFNYVVNRIKQYVIDNYVFNLDLATWGLTSKTKELDRFSEFLDPEVLKQSNALFGYEGDKYYFSLDIRRHFGLDQYNDDIIPYWKTETIEAMNAFRHKPSYPTGAGECVSLSALYAAALFIVGRVSLEDIFLIATPLHSQNFVTVNEGVITNNRRIVTKNMWFNGTSLSAKARRAIENEKINIVSHISGHIHTIYEEASINRGAYNKFSEKLTSFLVTGLNKSVFINFLRFKGYKSLFQYRDNSIPGGRYISLEKLFEYEHSSRFNFGLDSRIQLLNEIDGDEYSMSPLPDRILLNDLENILDRCTGKKTECIMKEIETNLPEVVRLIPPTMFSELRAFLKTEPRLPHTDKKFISSKSPDINTDDSREEIIKKIYDSAGESEMSMLTLYVHRAMDIIEWSPFVKAAIERNPVSFEFLEGKSTQETYAIINRFENDSIYDGKRLALPDEVWNFGRGDGIEKAFLMASWLLHEHPGDSVGLNIENMRVELISGQGRFSFTSSKQMSKRIIIPPAYNDMRV